MGPASAGADPGPACYGSGGVKPTCTDADLILGYLDPGFFAGGNIKLDREAAYKAIEENIAGPLALSVVDAAAGMYRVINTNMAQGVREVSVKRGYDPREFPMVVAGGAGPVHACMISRELEIPMFIVPRESSIFCAAGMLMSDLQHDSVRSFVSVFDNIEWAKLHGMVSAMIQDGAELLAKEGIPDDRRRFSLKLDCRYVKQYHEVSFPVALEAVRAGDATAIAELFHAEHKRLYGYSLEGESAPIELINVRLRAVGVTEKPSYVEEDRAAPDAAPARKGERAVYIPEDREPRSVAVYDGHKTRHGNYIVGPAIIEQVNTTLFLSASYACLCDRYGSFVVFEKGRESRLTPGLQEMVP